MKVGRNGGRLPTTLLGQLTNAQERAKGLIAETKGSADRTFVEAAIGSAGYPEETTANMAVIFNSLFGQGDIGMSDIRLAVDFQDYLDSLGYEIRRKTKRER